MSSSVRPIRPRAMSHPTREETARDIVKIINRFGPDRTNEALSNRRRLKRALAHSDENAVKEIVDVIKSARAQRLKARRGLNTKNVERILHRGRKRLEQKKAAGIDLSVLPPDSKINKKAEADWQRLLKYGFVTPSRGQAGREASWRAGTRVKRSHHRCAQAVELHRTCPELTEFQIADRLEPPLKGPNRDRTVRRYLTGR